MFSFVWFGVAGFGAGRGLVGQRSHGAAGSRSVCGVSGWALILSARTRTAAARSVSAW